MARFEVRQTGKLNLTSYSGLALIGQCCQAAQVEAVIDPRIPVSQGMRTSDVVKSVAGLLSLGKSDFEAIEPFRDDRFFKEALDLSKVPGRVWMRQRLNAKAGAIRDLADELSLRLPQRTEAPITPHKGYVCCHIDTFAMDNSGTKKEAVSRTYQDLTATRRFPGTSATKAGTSDSSCAPGPGTRPARRTISTSGCFPVSNGWSSGRCPCICHETPVASSPDRWQHRQYPRQIAQKSCNQACGSVVDKGEHGFRISTFAVCIHR